MKEITAYRIETIWNTSLCMSQSVDNSIRHGVMSKYNEYELIAFKIKGLEDAVFLHVPNPLIPGVNVGNQYWLGQTLALKAQWDPNSDDLIMSDPRTGLFLAALPLADGARQGDIHIYSCLAREWEKFKAVELDVGNEEYPKEILEISAAFAKSNTLWDGLRNILQLNGSYKSLQLLGHLADSAAINGMAVCLMREPDLANILSLAPERDVWAKRGVQDLLHWLSGDRLSEPKTCIGLELDLLSELKLDVQFESFAASCNVAMRRLILPRKKFAIVTSARNEGPYIIDFIAYHRAIGFEQIYIYTNNNSDGSENLLAALAQSGLVRLIYNEVAPGISPQYKAYNHSMQLLPDILDYEWVAAIDIDEYVRYNQKVHKSFADYISWQSALKVDSIQLPWATHGLNHEVHWHDASVTERFPNRIIQNERTVKCIYRPNIFEQNAIHFPLQRENSLATYRRADGQLTSAVGEWDSCSYDHAYISHFYFKSLQEYVARRVFNRGHVGVTYHIDVDMLLASVNSLMQQFENGATTEDGISYSLKKAVALEREGMMRLPGVAQAHQACCRAFSIQAERIIKKLGEFPAFQDAKSPAGRLLSLVSDHPGK